LHPIKASEGKDFQPLRRSDHLAQVAPGQVVQDHGKDSFAILTHPTPSGHNWQIIAD